MANRLENYHAVIQAPTFSLGVALHGSHVSSITFLSESIGFAQSPKKDTHEAVQLVQSELNRYFENPNFNFTVKLSLAGTPFQRQVWRALQKIPLGETRTYGQLARLLNTSARAVGNACRRNPVPIVVPCHRVVAKHGKGGFAGETQGAMIAIKDWLLQHEKYHM